MNNIKVCYTCNDNYAQYTCVSMASILKNSEQNESIHFYIIGDNISEKNKQYINKIKEIKECEITFIDLDKQTLQNFETIKTTDYLPLTSFFRLKISSLIKNEEKIIYLDPDTIVNSSLWDFYNTNIDNYYIGGIPDIGNKRLLKRLKLTKTDFYINSGVLLINLTKWREDNVEELFVEQANKNSSIIRLGDQDILNLCFEGNIYKFESKWNVQVINYSSCSDYSGYFNILHYTGSSKPWKFGSYIPAREHYFKYLKLTKYEKPNKIARIKSDIWGCLLYFQHRPLFFLRPGFYKYLKNFVLNKKY